MSEGIAGECLMNIGMERNVLAGLCQYGNKIFFDICDIVDANCFTSDTNNALYRAIDNIFQEDGEAKLDPVLIQDRVSSLGFREALRLPEHKTFLKNLFIVPINEANVIKFAAKIRKLSIARRAHGLMQEIQKEIENVTGNESIDEILGMVENPILEFSNIINGAGSNIEDMHLGIDEFIQNIIDNPNKTIGISSGYPYYDAAIGGGFRRKSVSLIGARTKVGKTLLSENIGWHVSKKNNIPVLYLDTEMSKEDHWARLLANISSVEINDIEAGKFVKNPTAMRQINKAKEEIKQNSKFQYINIAGKEITEVTSIMRRWLMQTVGVDSNGKTNNCLVIYDYFKLMSSEALAKNIQETQQLGFMLIHLVNFCIKYDFPVLSFVQLNRDGIDVEETNAISQSDRIAWYCSNFCIYKKKSDEEIAQDGPKGGNRKLVPVICRHGPGLESKEYICFGMQGKYGRITELCLNTALEKQDDKQPAKSNNDRDNGEGDIPF